SGRQSKTYHVGAAESEAPALMLGLERQPAKANRRGRQPQRRFWLPSGSVRMRLPVILKAAWAMADAVCGIACSPTPEIHLLLGPRLGRAIEGLRGVAAGPPGRIRCPRSAAIFASAAPSATTCSWRRARRSTRSMSPRRERWYQSLELV